MKCYKCNSILTDSDYCTTCGADVSVYKVVVKSSNAYYNSGLAKAQVRDLSGAVVALRTSIKINKNNVKARNLLGLVYYELGEVAVAIKEWVISLNIKPDKNVASAYIRKVKANPNKLEQFNQAIKKYNLALRKLQEGGDDVALIQLKKVINDNPHFVKGLLLLSLMYMKRGEVERCAKTLSKVFMIDRNNTLALRYRDELTHSGIAATDVKDENYYRGRRHGRDAALNAHDVIAPRGNYKEPSSGILTVVQLLAGVVVGVMLVWFLIVPAKLERAQSDNNEKLVEYSEQLASYSIDITKYQNEITKLQGELEVANGQIEGYSGNNGALAKYAQLVQAAYSYVNGDFDQATSALADIDVAKLPTDLSKELFQVMEEECGNAANYLSAGINAYNSEDYVKAISCFTEAYRRDTTDGNIPYYMARAYLMLKDEASAQTYIDIVNSDFANTVYPSQLNEFKQNMDKQEAVDQEQNPDN